MAPRITVVAGWSPSLSEYLTPECIILDVEPSRPTNAASFQMIFNECWETFLRTKLNCSDVLKIRMFIILSLKEYFSTPPSVTVCGSLYLLEESSGFSTLTSAVV